VGVSDAEVASLLPLDAIVCCTNRRLALDTFTSGTPRQRPLLIVDLGAPPNVETEDVIAAAVSLTRLTELESGDADDPARGAAVSAAEQLLESELRRYLEWQQARALHARPLRRAAA
jgi:glutamyl-tRNA reductase